MELLEHMKLCSTEDENKKIFEFEGEDWFKIGEPPQIAGSPIRAMPLNYFLWHLPNDMGPSMSLRGVCDNTATVIDTLQAAVPPEDICYECLSRDQSRWVE